MRTDDFDYDLPPEFIAQTPVEPRDSSRLLVLDRTNGQIDHRIFHEIGDYLREGDLLVLNQTRVIPARIYARKPTGGQVELLLLRKRDALTWEALVGGKGMRSGKTFAIENGPQGSITGELNGAERLVSFSEPIEPHFPKIGHVPLPPYIHAELTDPERYQTIYASDPGSAAAPTAGLHFTNHLLEELQTRRVQIAYVTLHVGLDTFAPVQEDDPTTHMIHTEWCQMSPETAAAINSTRSRAGRVVAVGTTSVRTIESAARQAERERTSGIVAPFTGQTDLYIFPGYVFRAVDAIITNFHLPRSTLIMLVSAFAGRELVLNTYETARKQGYRFYSFGDAMLIL